MSIDKSLHTKGRRASGKGPERATARTMLITSQPGHIIPRAKKQAVDAKAGRRNVRVVMTAAAPAPTRLGAMPTRKTRPRDPGAAARALKLEQDLLQREYRRLIRDMALSGLAQKDIAARLGISQAAVSKILKRIGETPRVPAGFSGASPYEVITKFVLGMIPQHTLLDQLSSWNYTARTMTDGIDWYGPPQSGSWEEVERALNEGLLSENLYDAILKRRATRAS